MLYSVTQSQNADAVLTSRNKMTLQLIVESAKYLVDD